MFSLEPIKYISLSINLLDVEGSSIGLPSLKLSFKLASISNVVGLLPKKPTSQAKYPCWI